MEDGRRKERLLEKKKKLLDEIEKIDKKLNTNKYQYGKIYIIKSKNSDLCYIGSTIETLRERFEKHKGYLKDSINGNKNISSCEILNAGDAYIELLLDYPCNTKEELELKEQEYILKYENAVNKNIPRNDPVKRQRLYYEEHKEHILEQVKEYRQKNRDKIRERERVRNKDPKRIEQRRKRDLENRDKINERRRETNRLKKEKLNSLSNITQ